MSSIEDGVEDRDARVAKAVLTCAGALIAGHVSIDLLALEQRYEGGSFFIDLPVGEGVITPLEVCLHRPDQTTAIRREALYLARMIKECASKMSGIVRDAERMLSACSAFAHQARGAGAPITIGRIRIEPKWSHLEIALGCVEVELLFPGANLDPARWWSQGSDVDLQRQAIAVVAAIVAPRARMKEALARHGAVCPIDPIAYAAMCHFGITVAMLRDSLSLSIIERRTWPLSEQSFIPLWRNGVVQADFELASGIRWWRDSLHVRQQLPATVVDAAAGRALTDVIDHSILRGATIAYANFHGRVTNLTIRPLAPLLLMPDGSALTGWQDEAAPPRAMRIDDDDAHNRWLMRQLIELSGMVPTFEADIGTIVRP